MGMIRCVFTYKERLGKVTPEAVKNTANKYLSGVDLVKAMFVPGK